MNLNEDEILLAALRKAKANGWEETYCPCTMGCYECCGHTWDEVTGDNLHFAVIFSHSFAKAFWGEERLVMGKFPPLQEEGCYEHTQPSWQYHLQQMVLEENPIKYLEKFL